MFNPNELRAYFTKNGMTQREVAKILGISSKTLGVKMRTGIFRSNEIKKLIELLNIEDPMRIFFNL